MIWTRLTKKHVVATTLVLAWLLDRVSKGWVSAHLELNQRSGHETSDQSLWLAHGQNPGAVFGWMADWPDPIRNAVFLVTGLLTVWLALSFYRSLAPGDKLNAFALGLVLGGGFGNLMDRLLDGHAVDFIRLPIWLGDAGSGPAFNLADLLIASGVAILLMELLASEGMSRVGNRVDRDGRRPGRVTAVSESSKEDALGKKNTCP